MNKICKTSTIVLSLVGFAHIDVSPSIAMENTTTLPSCESISADPDSDGFGWEAQTSCVVTHETTPAPEFVNRETGQPVLLQRAYWDPNADLANRNLSCRDFKWKETSLSYEPMEEGWFRFVAMPNQAPWVAHYFVADAEAELDLNLDLNNAPVIWNVEFGIFSDSTVHLPWTPNFGLFPAGYTHWVEPFTLASGAKAARFWIEPTSRIQRNPDYVECIDSAGESLQASGHWDRPAAELPSAYIDTPLYFNGLQEPQPAIANLETGQQVQFETGTWELQSDLLNREVACVPFDYNGTSYVTNDFRGIYQLEYQPRLTGDDTDSTWRWGRFDGVRFSDEWNVYADHSEDEVKFANSMWYEPITDDSGAQGVRYWGAPGESEDNRSNSYQDCYARELWSRNESGPVSSFRPTDNAQPNTDLGDTQTGTNSDTAADGMEEGVIDSNNANETSATSDVGSGSMSLSLFLFLGWLWYLQRSDQVRRRCKY